MGKDIREVSEKVLDLVSKNENETIIEKDNLYYLIKINYSKRVVLITDITQNYLANKYYENEKLVLGLVDIDSYNQYQTILEEEIIFKVDVAVGKILDHLSTNYGVVYKKYGPGKFLLITNNSSIKKMQQVEFKFVKALQRYSKEIGVKISLSFGFGTGSTNYSEIQANARMGLSQSHSRGGDQITIVSSITDNIYYGGTSEALHESSRVKIRSISDKLSYALKRDTSINRVIITGHINADLDAMGAALGLVALARSAKKDIDVYIANDSFDNTTKNAIAK
jgi:c-di-AMP phosphodiesterase-like protein